MTAVFGALNDIESNVPRVQHSLVHTKFVIVLSQGLKHGRAFACSQSIKGSVCSGSIEMQCYITSACSWLGKQAHARAVSYD